MSIYSHTAATAVDEAIARFATVQDAYTALHDQMDALISAEAAGDISLATARLGLSALETPESNAAHIEAYKAIKTVNHSLAELAEKFGAARTALWITESIAQHGVTVPMVLR